MIEVDEYALLRRRLFLQRYVSTLANDVSALHVEGDERLELAITRFASQASELELVALSQMRTSNEQARQLLESMRETIREQRQATETFLRERLEELAEREMRVTNDAIKTNIENPSARGLVSEPINGLTIGASLAAAYLAYRRRLQQDLVRAATSGDAQAIARVLPGTRRLRGRDGLLVWRQNRIIRPNVDVLTNGVASKAAARVYKAARVARVDHVATLDYRTCPSCYEAERGSPYELGKQPQIPLHPNCRCVSLPADVDGDVVRPFVRDDRPVRDIPRNERRGRIGQTTQDIEQFFAAMTDTDRQRYLGRSRYRLWQAGKIDSISDLVNRATRQPLTLDQLPEL